MTTVFLTRSSLPRPALSEGDAAAILQDHYGLSGTLDELGSQQDRNFRLTTGEGRFVLKVSRADYAVDELEAQHAAFAHLSARLEGVRLPRVLPTTDGRDIGTAKIGGELLRFRLLTYLEGEPLTRRQHLSTKTIAAFGDLAGRLSLALADFAHPGIERELQWDMRHAEAVIRALLPSLTDADQRARLETITNAASAALEPHLSQLRQQPVHNDLTDDNTVTLAALPDGVIDFGDLSRGFAVAELVVTCAALLHHGDGDPFAILPAIEAFHALRPLDEAEIAALWPLIVLRAVVLVTSAGHQAGFDADNAYIAANAAHERRILEAATAVPLALMEIAIRQTLDRFTPPVPVTGGKLLRALDPATVSLIELDAQSAALDDVNWLETPVELPLLTRAAAETGFASTRYGEYRLTRTRLLSTAPGETFALGIELLLPPGTKIAAPFAGTVRLAGNTLTLEGEGATLILRGTAPELRNGASIHAGATLSESGQEGRLWVQLCRLPGIVPPALVTPVQAAAWAVLCPSPKQVVGFDCDAPSPENARLMETRKRHFAQAQKNYYARPPQIERGHREHMFDVEGRAYLDMVNNVTILGHGNPRLANAVRRQWTRLNTNSRFHYQAVAEFSERLAALAPEGLDTVFLVNSGSEANDLAIRLAWAASGARNMLCLLEGYHGWTVGADAVSTSIADNPAALTTRPQWVRPVVSPNTYRGPYRGPESTGSYVALAKDVIERLDAKGERLGGFICEPVYGNAGGIPLPPGYLKEIYAMVRARGGVCIADEVQVGYGRLGHYFWGVEQQGVVPDIISIAKGMGNGHPLGAVITTRAIADALENEGYFFSSAGGSPVSAVVGMTVLDILEDEGLHRNTRETGDYLKTRLEALGQRFPLVGAVHGMGLYLGVEFVRDRETLEPATEETAAICDRLLELGVIMQPTGDYLNVLKIKPPLCLSRESADFFVDMLAHALMEYGVPHR